MNSSCIAGPTSIIDNPKSRRRRMYLKFLDANQALCTLKFTLSDNNGHQVTKCICHFPCKNKFGLQLDQTCNSMLNLGNRKRISNRITVMFRWSRRTCNFVEFSHGVPMSFPYYKVDCFLSEQMSMPLFSHEEGVIFTIILVITSRCEFG